jgi:hypothetical protein
MTSFSRSELDMKTGILCCDNKKQKFKYMKIRLLFCIFLFIQFSAEAQYDQKISMNFDAGIFKTFGTKYTEYTGPLQMPNYGMGFKGDIGAQLKLSNHLSLSADFGIMITNRWNYKTPDTENYLYWTVDDPITEQVLEEGENYLDLHNFSLCVKPKYYLAQEKKWNPYFSAGVNINWTRCWFENNYWYAMEKWDQLGPDDTEPWNDYLLESFSIGFNPGFGVECSPSSMLRFYFETGYYLIKLDRNKFTDPERVENFNAIVFQAGLRLFFIKSKDL